MGFTRYWVRPRELDQKRFSEFAAACGSACASLDLGLFSETFNDDAVQFSAKPMSEPFIVERVSQGRERDGMVNEFCKTMALPYDQAVDVCLGCLREYFPETEIPAPQ